MAELLSLRAPLVCCSHTLQLLVAAPAWASLPVAYGADYKTLKKGVALGDALSFELFETADCTGTWASMALAAGKSVRWVAEQLGHSAPTLTLKTYAHAMSEEEADLSSADFGRPNDRGTP